MDELDTDSLKPQPHFQWESLRTHTPPERTGRTLCWSMYDALHLPERYNVGSRQWWRPATHRFLPREVSTAFFDVSQPSSSGPAQVS